jgi:hypothetical protein
MIDASLMGMEEQSSEFVRLDYGNCGGILWGEGVDLVICNPIASAWNIDI